MAESTLRYLMRTLPKGKQKNKLRCPKCRVFTNHFYLGDQRFFCCACEHVQERSESLTETMKSIIRKVGRHGKEWWEE